MVDLSGDLEARKALIAETGHRTVPQIFIGETFIAVSTSCALDRGGKLIWLTSRKMTAVRTANSDSFKKSAKVLTPQVHGFHRVRDTPKTPHRASTDAHIDPPTPGKGPPIPFRSFSPRSLSLSRSTPRSAPAVADFDAVTSTDTVVFTGQLSCQIGDGGEVWSLIINPDISWDAVLTLRRPWRQSRRAHGRSLRLHLVCAH